MATGQTAIFVTPAADFLTIPEGWTIDYTSDVLPEAKTIYADEFTDFDHEPDAAEIDAALGVGEENAELRQWDGIWRLRRRFPVTVTTEIRGGIARIYKLSDPKLPASWGHAACFWWVHSTAAKLKLLHEYIYTTLGFGPVAGALAALDPTNQTQFLAKAVQTAAGLTNVQQLARVTAIRNALNNLGYTTPALTAIVDVPTGKTEDDLIRALVSDLGFTMPQLFKTMIRGD